METALGMSVTGWLVLALLSLLSWWFWKTRQLFQTIEKMGLSGPRPSFFVGNMKEITTKGFGAAFKDWEKEYGPIYGIYRVKRPSIVIHDPDMLREIMVKQFDTFPNRMQNLVSDKEPLCNRLQFTKDDHWRHVRKTLSPSFSTGKLKAMLPIIQRSCRHLTERASQLAKSGQQVDIKELCNAYAMDITAGVGFGLEVSSIQNPGEPFTMAAKRILYPPQWRFTFLFLFPVLFDLLGLNILPKRESAYMTDIIRAALKERRHDKGQRYKDYLQCLVDAEKEGGGGRRGEEKEGEQDSESDAQLKPASHLDPQREEEVEANSLNFLLAGYENVATSLAFLLYNLAAHPHCVHALHQEIDSLFGQEEVDYRVVTDMPYLDMCLNESLRLYPPGLLLDRECVKDTQIKGLHLPAGIPVSIPVYSIHTDPNHWPDPFTFDPERHRAEAKARRHPFSFIPFGMGPRNCIGMRMSQMEIKIAVAAILQKFSPVLSENSVFPAQISNHVHLSPVDTMWVKFHPRSA